MDNRLTSLLEIDATVINHKYLKPAVLAPLPFLGQKRQFLKVIEQRLKLIKFDPQKPLVFVDAFGGSGLLCNRIKNLYPEAQVIWNDFDNYLERLDHIEETDKLLEQLYVNFAGEVEKQKTFDGFAREEIKQTILDHHKEYGYVDLKTLGCNLLFSGNYFSSLEDLVSSNRKFFNRLTLKARTTDGYLHGVERVSMDGFELLRKVIYHLDQFEGQVVLVLDPPYISSHSDGYECDFWKLRDFKPLMEVIRQANVPYILFGSGKSDIKELYDLRQEAFEEAAQQELDL